MTFWSNSEDVAHYALYQFIQYITRNIERLYLVVDISQLLNFKNCNVPLVKSQYFVILVYICEC